MIVTDRVRRTREGYVLTRVCPSICLSTGGGGGAAKSDGGGHPRWGTPCKGGTPPGRTTDGVLDTPRSVWLLRSRRRTFSLLQFFIHTTLTWNFSCFHGSADEWLCNVFDVSDEVSSGRRRSLLHTESALPARTQCKYTCALPARTQCKCTWYISMNRGWCWRWGSSDEYFELNLPNW